MPPKKPRYWKSLQLREGQIVSARDKSPWTVGEWREVPAPICECEGLNCCENIIEAMRYVNIEVLAEVEIDGKRIVGDDKITAQRMRIIRAWRWTREDTVLLVAYEMKLYFEYLGKLWQSDAVHSKKEIESAKALIENPTYENMLAAMAVLFGGSWADAAYAGAFYVFACYAASFVSSYIGGRAVFSKEIKANFFKKSHGWIVKHTAVMEAI